MDQGYKDGSLEEATNLRHRLLKDLPIKDWRDSNVGKEEMGAMKDFLFNKDLAKEITAGDVGSVKNLQRIHSGLCHQMKGSDSRIIMLGKHWRATNVGAHFQCSPESDLDFYVRP